MWCRVGDSHRVVTLDVHNLAAYENAFRCVTEHLGANGLFVEHFVPLLADGEAIVVSPDAGGIKRAERFRQRLAAALGRPVAAAVQSSHAASSTQRRILAYYLVAALITALRESPLWESSKR